MTSVRNENLSNRPMTFGYLGSELFLSPRKISSLSIRQCAGILRRKSDGNQLRIKSFAGDPVYFQNPTQVRGGRTEMSGRNRSVDLWPGRSRMVVFVLAASSIACLVADLYGVCRMNFFTIYIFLPALLLLWLLAVLDRLRGKGHVWRAVWMGAGAGLLAAVAYDAFRLPFVFAKEWGIDGVV